MEGSATPRTVVGPFVYARFHGPVKYGGRYSDDQLEAWADWCAVQIEKRVPVYAYFNNDTGGHAPRDAVRLRSMIEARMRLGAGL
jgi:uncharacterized protein YecE (DUF72 family)